MKSSNYSIALLAAAVGILTPAHAEWALLDDMEGGNLWTGAGTIAADPADPGNMVYSVANTATLVSGYLAIPEIADGATATLFFRIRSTANAGRVDWIFGASDEAAPVPFNSYEGYARLAEDGDVGNIDIDIRNGGGFAQVGDAASDVWYSIWIVLNNGTDTADVYFNSGTGPVSDSDPAFLGGGFRNGTTGPLITLLVGNNEVGTTAFIDDVYIDISGENLADPTFQDSDGDGLSDAWEIQNGLDPEDDGSTELENGADGDPDEDNLSNLREFRNNTFARNPDSDGDTLLDGDEIDGTSNSYDGSATSPLLADSDADGVPDGDENGALNIRFGNAPTNPNDADSDFDGIPDAYELRNNSEGTALDPNDDGTTDPSQDPFNDRDGDGIANLDEFAGVLQTRADLADTDGDGYSDGVEDNLGFWDGPDFTGTNPLLADTDGDGLLDGQENPELSEFPGAGVFPTNSDPNLADTDGDEFGDGFEVANDRDPGDSGVAPAQPAGFNLVEDFEGEGMTLGESFHGVGGWTAAVPSVATVGEEPIAGGDQVGVLQRAGSLATSQSVFKSLDLSGLRIREGDTGTLFMQIYCSAPSHDVSFGLSDQARPATGDFPAFEAQAVTFPGSIIRVRDAAAFRDVSSYPTGEWMNVWIVANNDVDSVSVYWESPAGESGRVEITDDGGVDPFDFRNGTFEPLVNVLMIVAAGNVADTPLYVDNIYVDPSAVNLETPAAAKPKAVTDLRITDVGFNAEGGLSIRFVPGGPGFRLTRSNDLEVPFLEETGASYDNVDTFTVPAGLLDIDRSFFRIESP